MPLSAVSIELKRRDWGGYRCGCGDTADHLVETFKRLLYAEVPEDVVDYGLDGHVEIQSMLFEVALPATSLIMAALMEDLPAFVRAHFLVTLLRIVSGESHSSEVEAGNGDLQEECIDSAREGLWLLYREAMSGDTQNAIDILEFIDFDEDRLDFYKSEVRSRMD
ncbi:hypothetical protein [Streptomyces sp. NBC_01190]|uniref:hypothetical protein n=1 Tax=Streptomyces sp. NBC_01190 TaxID=2903767 RepID=UPI00386BF142|nr:hypothetical protein OG519_19555 [Streptomyces sp. NBC_01190]